MHYFYTGDGPSHIYNANIISSLLTNPDSAFAPFYNLRYELIPNMGGHAILAFFTTFFDAVAAEKVVYLLYLITLPLAFRYAVLAFEPKVNPLVYFVFLLLHNFCFYIGFQSFSLGLVFLFFTIGFTQKICGKLDVKNLALWSAILFLTSIFHLLAAAIALLVTGVLLVIHFVKNPLFSAKKLVAFALATPPTLLFFLHFLWDKPSGLASVSNVFDIKFTALFSTLVVTVYDQVGSLASILLSAHFVMATLLVVAVRIREKRKFAISDFALYSAILILALYFILPDRMASGGFISIRLLLCMLLLWAFWLAVNASFSVTSIALGILLIALSLIKIPSLLKQAQMLDEDAQTLMEVLPYLEEGNTLLPLNYSDHWLHYNLGLYLGAEKEIVVLDNYEAATNHFPVMWNERVYSDQDLGDFYNSNRPTLFVRSYEESTGIQVDAVVRWLHNDEMKDAATLHTDSVLAELFNPAYSSANGSVELYLRKKEP